MSGAGCAEGAAANRGPPSVGVPAGRTEEAGTSRLAAGPHRIGSRVGEFADLYVLSVALGLLLLAPGAGCCRARVAAGQRTPTAILRAVDTSLAIVQIIISVALISAILLQNKGTGLGSVFGGDGSVFRTRRGAEKGLFNLTIVLAVVFGGISFASAVLTHSAL